MPETIPSVTARTPLRPTLLLAALFVTITFFAHFFSSLWGMHLGYGYFRDELYFLVCGHHLAWGYVDQPPLVAVQARLAEMLFGLSPTRIRIFSFLAAGAFVGLTGLLAWQFGGRRSAQALAMSGILAAPVLIGTGNYLSMNSFEPCFWMGSLLVVIRLADGSAQPRAWLLFGLLAGLGIENKHSTVFFLVALLAGLLLTPQRRILFTKGCAAGVAVLILVALPNLLWQWTHHFPTYELLSNIANSDKNIKLPPFAFLYEQIKIMLFSTAPLWVGGALWLTFARHARVWRFAAFTFLIFVAMMMVMHAKHYYVAPIYPVVFAAGAVGFGQFARREWMVVTYGAVLFCTFVFATGPIVLTILPPDKYDFFTSPFGPRNARFEKFTSPLPQILSDRFGWPEMVDGFAKRYDALPPDVRAHTAIFCGNYGEASAVNILGPKYGLPTAISGHQNYFYWGWNGYSGESVLTLGKDGKDYADKYAEVVDLGPFDSPWTMDHEHLRYFWLRHRKRSYAQDWSQFKLWL
ncbi:MAG: glycosyltransferase family 39 protein [Terracidiphilus sp.]